MKKSVFYSWQSDIHEQENRYLIRDALTEALKKMNQGLVLDEATRGVPGNPPIFDSILRKIDDALLFVADFSLVGQYSNEKWTLNPNVLVEYGYALSVIKDTGIIPVMNTHYGSLSRLPFDLRNRAVRVQYTLEPNAPSEKRKEQQNQLVGRLQKELKLVWENVIAGGLTDAGLKFVEYLVTSSEDGLPHRPLLTHAQLAIALKMDEIQVRNAIDELEGRELIARLPTSGVQYVSPLAKVFIDFDALFMGWTPADDARQIAEDVVAGSSSERVYWSARDLVSRYGWAPRRLNSALHFLKAQGLVQVSQELNATFAFSGFFETPATRRFVRS